MVRHNTQRTVGKVRTWPAVSLARAWPMRAAWLLSLALVLAGASAASGAAPENRRLFMQISRTAGPENVVYGFFDEATGERVARLQIAKLSLDYGKHGVFRVAWKPRAVLQGVHLKLFQDDAWSLVGGQLETVLAGIAPREALVLRELTFERAAATEPALTARTAELTADGHLRLQQAQLGAEQRTEFRLPLRTPAGEPAPWMLFASAPATAPAVGQTFSSP